MEPFTVIGSVAAGMQLVSTAAKALLATIQLIKDLKEITPKLALLLLDVDSSISRLCHSIDLASTTLKSLKPAQSRQLSLSIQTLYPALREIHTMLTSVLGGNKGPPLRRLWTSIVSLKLESELSSKLTRLNRLNMEVIRDVSFLGIELQGTTRDLVLEGQEASQKAFSDLGTKMDVLRGDLQAFTISVQNAHTVTLGASTAHDTDTRQGDQPRTMRANLYIPVSPEDKPSSQGRDKELHQYLSTSSNAQGLPLTRIPQRPQHANLEFIFFNIRTFYTIGNFDALNIKPQGRFWKDTKLAIYLVKSSNSKDLGSSRSENRGLRLLEKSSGEAASNLNNGTASLLIELLSTLAPTNTALCPYIREALLQYLESKLCYQLSPGHPIALVLGCLKNDKDDPCISIRALKLLTERLRTVLGPAHELTELATRRLCALLRRSEDFSEALCIGNEGARAIRAHYGYPNSLAERMLLRQVEQTHMAKQDWLPALSTCFEIVGQRSTSPGSDPDPTYHDECAVYTMEDIAKICECSMNFAQAIAWLKQARISGGMAWGQAEALWHIQDKLIELLRKLDREEELKIWSIGFEDDIDKPVST